MPFYLGINYNEYENKHYENNDSAAYGYGFIAHTDEYNEFKQEFSQYDNHFWPTKYIREIEDNGREILNKTSVYPWDVTISDGKQFAYKVVTYYDESELTKKPILYYYPFTYNTYAGIDPKPVMSTETVSESDVKKTDSSN